jgi:hypothetical protein
MKAKTTTKKPGIRIVNVNPATFKKVVVMAAKEKRSLGKQSELLIEAGLKSLSNLETV